MRGVAALLAILPGAASADPLLRPIVAGHLETRDRVVTLDALWVRSRAGDERELGARADVALAAGARVAAEGALGGNLVLGAGYTSPPTYLETSVARFGGWVTVALPTGAGDERAAALGLYEITEAPERWLGVEVGVRAAASARLDAPEGFVQVEASLVALAFADDTWWLARLCLAGAYRFDPHVALLGEVTVASDALDEIDPNGELGVAEDAWLSVDLALRARIGPALATARLFLPLDGLGELDFGDVLGVGGEVGATF